jgi:hypothetical protein
VIARFTATPQRTAALLVVAVAGIVYFRVTSAPMDAFGDSGAQYIDHLARARLVERVEGGVDVNPLLALVQLDGLYPPGLHLVTAALSQFLGTDVADVVPTGLGWWVLLVWAVGRCGARLGDDARAGAWAMAAAAALPATHAVVTRYHYDLPMTALLWAAVAVGLGPGPAARRGLGAGLLGAMACLVKWTALPFGLAMGAGLVAWKLRVGGRSEAMKLAAAATVGLLLPILAFALAGSTSFGAMSGATFQPPPGIDPEMFAGLLALPGGGVLRAGWLQLMATDGPRLAFYPSRLVMTVLSPAVAIVAVPAWVAWLRNRAPGAELISVTVVGQLAFLLLLVPPLDERFLLTLAPGLALAAGLGAAALPPVPRRALAAVATFVAVGVAADFHLRGPSPPLHTDRHSLRSEALDGRALTSRFGLGSSWDLRGWARRDEARADRTALRAAAWSRFVSCGATPAALPAGTLTAWGDDNWLAWRSLVEAQGGGATLPPLLRVAADPADAFGPPDAALPPSTTLITDPDGGPGLQLSGATPGAPCQ